MLSLRTLRFVALVFLPVAAKGAVTHSVQFTMQSESKQGPLDIGELSRNYSTSRLTEQLQYNLSGLSDSFNLTTSIFTSHPDYSSTLTRTKNGVEEPLSKQTGKATELSSEIGLNWVKSQDELFLVWKGDLSENPFFTNIIRSGYQRSFYSQTTIIGINGAYLSQKQPESYFLDLDFKTKERPRIINAYEAGVTHEQILSERWKMRNILAIGQRIEERPKNISFKTKQGYALLENLFAEMEFSIAEELRSESLKNERGYFRVYGGRLAVTCELNYDLLVSISYGLFFEREENPSANRLVEVASDQYGAGINYTLWGSEFDLRAGYAVTNTQIRNLSLAGGLSWQL